MPVFINNNFFFLSSIIVGNIGGLTIEIYIRRAFLERMETEKQRQRTQSLLLSFLPETVVEELNARGSSRPIRVESATILFSDFVHFTRITRGIDPVSVVAVLNAYFSSFDAAAKEHNVERLRIIGDGYMCAGGVPCPNRTHAIDVCTMALEMLHYVSEARSLDAEIGWQVRIGINTGMVTAGIVGKSKFSYDIWGDAVNTASRLETSGVEGGINVSKCTYLLTRNIFDFRPRGLVEIKGGESLEMYELLGLKPTFVSEGKPNALFSDAYRRIQVGELLLGFDI